MLIKNLKVSGLLSFGPRGIDLPMRPLNVLIGANGSGKSNLLEVLALLRATPTGLARPVKETGGIRDWLWKRGNAESSEDFSGALIEAIVGHPNSHKTADLRHSLGIEANGEHFELVSEEVGYSRTLDGDSEPWWFYRFKGGTAQLHINQFTSDHGPGTAVEVVQDSVKKIEIPRGQLNPAESILSQDKSPFGEGERYRVFEYLRKSYGAIQLHRDWEFGPRSQMRLPKKADGRDNVLVSRAENLANVIFAMPPSGKRRLSEEMRAVYDGITGIDTLPSGGGRIQLYLEENGGREIPATRLSDGTLHYLCLVAILLHHDPPPLMAIEEPELGLHPDLVPRIAVLLKEASERTQLVVTTHSRMLVDALGDTPESVIVCEKQDGESVFERLDGPSINIWLEKYSLGDLWSKGEIGGNRW